MKNLPFTIERVLNAPLAKVWKAITNKDDMKHWYFNLSEFKPEVGFEFSFPGQGHKGEKYLHHCKITEVVKERNLFTAGDTKAMREFLLCILNCSQKAIQRE